MGEIVGIHESRIDTTVYELMAERDELKHAINKLKHELLRQENRLEIYATEAEASEKRESGYRKIIAALCFRVCAFENPTARVFLSKHSIEMMSDELEFEDLPFIHALSVLAKVKDV